MAALTIGDFSRMTYLSVKALRHYHEIGLLEPAEVDPASGYRLYRPAQVPTAQFIRRLRDLDMPLEIVKAVLDAPDATRRNAVVMDHLRQMENRLGQIQDSVASLRQLLEQRPSTAEVEYRSVPASRVLAISEPVPMAQAEAWLSAAFEEIAAALASGEKARAGPEGALYFGDFFEADAGQVMAFVPLIRPVPDTGRAFETELPATEMAVVVHAGAFTDLDQTYGALGTFVAEHAIGADGPIRENYIIGAADTQDVTRHRTEVCWPIKGDHA